MIDGPNTKKMVFGSPNKTHSLHGTIDGTKLERQRIALKNVSTMNRVNTTVVDDGKTLYTLT
jgi:hypothetical protein